MTIKDKIRLAFEGQKGKVFRPHEIIDIVQQKYPDTNKSSILPADCCYNLINKGIVHQFNFHVFEWLRNGTYRCLGEGCSFDGPIFWKRKIVGEWKNGQKPEQIILD